jgi:phosphomannomutase/phosphoglucomutase
MNPHIFRAYDIRGRADRDLSDEVCRDLGRALGSLVVRAGGSTRAGKPEPVLAVGRDCRASSPRIHAAFVDGVLTTGASVVDVGMVPTPVLYFAAKHWRLGGHAMITGSHNPPEDNGFKVAEGTSSLHGAAIQELRGMIERGDFVRATSGARGLVEERDATRPYLDFVRDSLRLGDRRCRVALDAGNGVGGPTASRLYRDLGFDLIALHCEPDGTFPNHHPDPTVEANLADVRAAVANDGAELGIALDGDADRIGAIDGRGRVLWGDQLMILFARVILRDKPGATFIAEVKCSQTLFDEIERAGGKPVMWNVGHSFIKAKMKELGAELAGEMSGHLFFSDRYLGYDDGIYAGARLLEILSQSRQTLADLYDTLPVTVNTPELRIDCPDDIKFAVVERATERLRRHPDVNSVIDVDGARAKFAGGWGLVRASNTGPVLVLRCEADTPARLAEIRAIVEAEVAAARRSL